MTIATIDYTNMMSQAWQNVFDIIDNRTYVADPVSVSGRKFVYTREPRLKTPDFQGFPFIVVDQAKMIPVNQMINYKRKGITHSITVVVYSTDMKIPGQANGKGVNFLNSISDDLVESFNGSFVKEILRPYKVDNLSIEATDSDVVEIEDDFVFTRTFEITFKGIRTVSA